MCREKDIQFKQGTGNTFLFIDKKTNKPLKHIPDYCSVIEEKQACYNCRYDKVCPYSSTFVELGEEEL